MRELIRLIKWLAACVAAHNLAREVADKKRCLEGVRCDLTRGHMLITIRQLEHELSVARAHYLSFYPPGHRMTWG